MPFKIGEVYRYSSRKKGQSVPPQIVDGMPNFYYETYGGDDKSSISFQKGVHNLAAVKLKDGSKRQSPNQMGRKESLL